MNVVDSQQEQVLGTIDGSYPIDGPEFFVAHKT